MTTIEPHTDMTLDDRLRRDVAAWRARHGVSARRFGMDALGDPGFVASQIRGRSVRLATADRVLAFMGESPLGPVFRREVEAFLAVTGTKPSVLGEEATGNPSFVGRLRRGSSPRLATLDRVRAWMAGHANEDELRAIRARMADMTNAMNPFAEDAAGLRILKVQDDSMEPEIHEGDRVVFDLSSRLPAAGGTFALRDGDGLVVRRVEALHGYVEEDKPPRLRFITTNPDYAPSTCLAQDVHILGKAMWVVRRV